MKTRKRIAHFLVVLLLLMASVCGRGQSVGISADGSVPNSSAILDIKSFSKGLLIPRTKTNAIASPVMGLLIYDTTTNSFWYHNGTTWNELGKGGAPWSLTGNSGTVDGTNFIGTTDAVPINFRVNNQKAGKITYGSSNNFSLGYLSMLSVTSGINDLAMGFGTLYGNKAGNNNLAVGYQTLTSMDSASNNVAVGYEVMVLNSKGDGNVALGYSPMYANTTGSANTVVGVNAMYYSNTAINNTAVGVLTLNQNQTGAQNTAIGTYAMGGNNGTNNVGLGFLTLINHKSGESNTAIGANVMYNDTSSYNNTAAGDFALQNNWNGSDNCAIGFHALWSHKVNDRNAAIGSYALQGDTAGYFNEAVGYQAAMNWYNGSENAGFGKDVMINSTSGFQNTAMGSRAMGDNISGHSNTAFGYAAMRVSSTGNYNTAIGDSTLIVSSALNNSTVLGAKASVSVSNTMAFGSTAVNRWVFARDNAASGVFQVGYNTSNGNGAYLSAGGVWTDISDRSTKDGIEKMKPQSVLNSIAGMPVTKWKYKGTADEFHIGPMAQDFQQAFHVGDGKSISAMDKTGVALLSIQALNEENDMLKTMISQLEQRIAKLEKD